MRRRGVMGSVDRLCFINILQMLEEWFTKLREHPIGGQPDVSTRKGGTEAERQRES